MNVNSAVGTRGRAAPGPSTSLSASGCLNPECLHQGPVPPTAVVELSLKLVATPEVRRCHDVDTAIVHGRRRRARRQSASERTIPEPLCSAVIPQVPERPAGSRKHIEPIHPPGG